MGLADDWAQASLSELAGTDSVFRDGDWVESKDQDPNGDVRLIQLADIGDGCYTSKSKRFLTSAKASELKCTYLTPGDLLIARMPDPLGRACIFPGDPKPAVTVVDVCILRLPSDIDHRWLMHAMNSPAMRNQIAAHQSGSTRKRISRKNLGTVQLRVPPLVEQRAIVAKIESLFSELDQGVAQLEAVRAQLGRYRQSVLKAAFEGRLTAQWREKRRDERRREAEANGEPLPTADGLLARIRAEREAAHAARLAEWERAVAAWEEAGGKASGTKKPRKPAAPKDPPPLTKEELADLPELPEGWVWCRLDLLADVSGGLTKNAKRDALPLRLPYLRVANVYSGRLELSEIKDIGVTEADRDKTLLVENDLLFVEGNGSADQIGRVARWTGVIDPCLHQNHLIRARPLICVGATYLVHWFLSPIGRERIMREASSTSGLHTLSISKVSALLTPIAPPAEQAEIVNEIDARLSVVDAVERTIAAALKQAEALRQSILKKAFEGRLLAEAELAAVRANPAYEPADQLLARIRESNAAAAPKKKTRRKRKAAEASP